MLRDWIGRVGAWLGSWWPRPGFRWVLLNLLCHGVVLVSFGIQGTLWDYLGLLFTPLLAWLFWIPLVLTPLQNRPRWNWCFWTLWLLWLGFCFGHQAYLGAYPDHGTLEFSLSEPTYAWVLGRERIAPWMALGLAAAVLGGRWLSRASVSIPARWRWWRLLGTLLLLTALQKLDISSHLMAPDVTSLRMLAETRMRRIGAGGLRRALGRDAAPKGPAPSFRVLLLVHESLNGEAFDPELAPHWGTRLSKGEILTFPKAFAPATMTDVALPALFAGLSPAQSSEVFHKVPLLWHRAKAHGMDTALLSIQRLNYYGFRDYLLADGLDTWTSTERAELPLVNDSGADDRLLLEAFRPWLLQHKERPTFTILHFNATHAPYLQAPGFTPWTAEDVARRRPQLEPERRATLARYWNAIRYQDHVQEQVLQLLEEQGLLEDTWVIATSDHGEGFAGRGVGRMEDLRPETLRVPLWMRLPASFPKEWRQGLEANRRRLTGNLDLMATVAEALGDPPPAGPGASLLRPLPPGRVLPSTNSGEIRARDPQVVSLLLEEGDALLQWRWHAHGKGDFFSVNGISAIPGAASPERISRVRAALAAYPGFARVEGP